MKIVLTLCLLFLTTSILHASSNKCSKNEVLKMINTGYKKSEIDVICNNMVEKKEKPTKAQIKKAIKRSLDFSSVRCGTSFPGSKYEINSFNILKEAKYNKKDAYYAYSLQLNLTCYTPQLFSINKGLVAREEVSNIKVRLSKDDFGVYKASSIW